MSDTPEWSSPDQRPQPEGQPQYQQPGFVPPPQAPKPGVIPLRPLSVGEILDGAITTMRRYPKVILGVSAVIVAITQFASALIVMPMLEDLTRLTQADPNSLTEAEARDMALSTMSSALIGGGASLLLTLIATTFLSGYVTVVVGRAVLGQPISFGEAWREFKPRLLPLLLATVLIGLLLIGGFLLCIIPGIWLMVLFSLVTPALVLERGKVMEAFSRSRVLIRNAWWRTFGVLLLAVLISYMINSIVSLPFTMATMDWGALLENRPPKPLSFVDLLLAAIGGTIAGTITYPFSSAVTVLLYVDRRMRAEGMDIELARAAGLNGGQ